MTDADPLGRRVLIVDDEPSNIGLLEMILRRAGYARLQGTTDPRDALRLFAEFRPDILLLDLNMPRKSGFEVLDDLRAAVDPEDFFPVLVLTGDATKEAKQRVLSGGAKDFLAKPFDPTEVLLRIRNLLETQTLHRRLRAQNRDLEARVRERTRDLEAAWGEALDRLSLAAEFRDDSTGRHAQRVGRTSARLSAALGLGTEEAALLRRAAPLHDVGKIGVPDAVLLKPGPLDADDLRAVRAHATIGGDLLAGSRSPVFRVAELIARTHHENWDGSGYPLGLSGEAIPLAGRIAAVADVFDALTHARPYKAAWPAEAAAAEVERLAGSKFDPRVAAAFAELHRAGVLEAQ